MYENGCHLMISDPFVRLLRITMKPEKKRNKNQRARDEPLPQTTEQVSVVVGNIKQPLPPRDGAEVTLKGRAKGGRAGVLLQRVFTQSVSLVRLHTRGERKDEGLSCKHRRAIRARYC